MIYLNIFVQNISSQLMSYKVNIPFIFCDPTKTITQKNWPKIDALFTMAESPNMPHTNSYLRR